MISMCLMVLGLAQFSACATEPPPPCDSEIYCHGPLLHTIQMAKIYQDSKTFVDMKMKYSPNETLLRFEEFMKTHNSTPTRNQVRLFVSDTFDGADGEFEPWIPADWKSDPKFLNNIHDTAFRRWGSDLNGIWKVLGRKIKQSIEQNQEQYSIIWVPNPVVVPGGRFREFYYWDSYWIAQGLLLSEMYETVKGMLTNFLFIVEKYGHIPNGGRIYYLERSQPPMLVPMVKAYVDATQDYKFIENNIDTMDKEFTYWMTKHTRVIQLDGKNYTLALYGDESLGPRPESYSEDVDSAAIFHENNQKEAFYSNLKAAAESGWDFSSRWFITNATSEGNLTNINTRSIVPVDLNSVIYWNAILLAEFHRDLNRPEKVQYYTDIANKWLEAVTAVLWHEEVGVWLDYDLLNSIKREYFYPTNIAPLWTGCYDRENRDKIVRLVLKYLDQKHVMHPGGIPTTMQHTGEQWDYPNAWPPLQHMMIVGLNNTGDQAAQRLAFEMTENWVRSNYKAYNETEAMYEKYDATAPGRYGGGGEYDLQIGFGWTNGIIMDLLDKYGYVLRLDDVSQEEPSPLPQNKVAIAQSTFSQVSTALLALLVSLTAGFIGVFHYCDLGFSPSVVACRIGSSLSEKNVIFFLSLLYGVINT